MRFTQIFEIFSRKFSFYLTLLPEFLKFSVEWFAFRKEIQHFLEFLKLLREISGPFAAVSRFSKVLVKQKAPMVSVKMANDQDRKYVVRFRNVSKVF